jgi:hypothetical protein
MKPIKVHPLAKMILSHMGGLSFKPESFSFGCKVEESRNVLICMPTDIDRFALARDLLTTFTEIFHPREVFVLLPFLEAKAYLSDTPDYQVISADKEDLNILSLPRKNLVERLRGLQFDISLDLDMNGSYFNRYLCLKCKIPLRIGVKSKKSFPLYNIQLAVVKSRLGSRDIYEGMIDMLKILFSGSGESVPHRG